MSNQQLEKVTVRLHAGDSQRLAEYYPNIGYNQAIRTIVKHHLRSLDEQTSQLRSSVNIEEL